MTYTVRARMRVCSLAEPYRLIHANGYWYVLVRHIRDEGWTAHRTDRVHAVRPTGAHFEPRPLPVDAGDLWLDLLIWYDRGRPRREQAGAIRCEDAR